MKLGCGYPMGPFEQLDEIGLDAPCVGQQALYRQSPEPGLARRRCWSGTWSPPGYLETAATDAVPGAHRRPIRRLVVGRKRRLTEGVLGLPSWSRR